MNSNVRPLLHCPRYQCFSHGNPGQFSLARGEGARTNHCLPFSNPRVVVVHVVHGIYAGPRSANSTEVVWDQKSVLPCIFIRRRRPAVKANCPSNLRSRCYTLTRRRQLASCSMHRCVGVRLCFFCARTSRRDHFTFRFWDFFFGGKIALEYWTIGVCIVENIGIVGN